jgi:hypothetical protein
LYQDLLLDADTDLPVYRFADLHRRSIACSEMTSGQNALSLDFDTYDWTA